MKASNRKRRTIKLDDVRQNNIVWTDLNDGLAGSIFEQHFKKAVQTIGEIIGETKKHETKSWQPPCGEIKNRDCRTCRHRDSYGCRESTKPPVNWTKFHTAVPFIGERGTGKTSVMFSVLEYLKRYHGESVSGLNFFDDVRFITFDMIDAAMLTSTEDVMEIILSRMLNYLVEFSGESDFRDLYRQIDELHKNMNRVYGKKPDSREGYGLSSLQQIADGQKVKTSFRDLVSDFRNVISHHKFANKECYLVIALDDVDLYQGAKSGLHDAQYALLEHIYNYMRIPGLVVLMTYNEYILRRECSRHFAHIYFGDDKPKEREYTPSEREDIDNLTAQFMSKLFPQERRIYLPNYLFVNTNNEADLYITPVLNGEKGEDILAPFSKDQEPQVKEFMLRLIAHRTGVYFDVAGTKRHFFESRNLREFGELFQIINDMKNPENDDFIRAENCQKMLNYFYDQYALKHLETGEYRKFQQIAMLPIARQKVLLIDRIHGQLTPYFFEDNAKRKQDGEEDVKRWKYSYGELLRCMYYATRYDKNNRFGETTLYSKEFMHCILGTHSVIMNRLAQHSTQGQLNEQERNREQENIREIIGSSIAGKWANKMLPSVKVIVKGTKNYVSDDAGSISHAPITRYFDWMLPQEVLEAIWNYRTETDVLKKYLEALLLVGMFFTGAPDELRIKLDPDIDENKNLVVYMRSDSEKYICFNVLNFVINLYNKNSEDRNTYFSNMREKLTKLGSEFAQKLSPKYLDGEINTVQIQADELKIKKQTIREKSKIFEPDLDSLDSGHSTLAHRKEVLATWKVQVVERSFAREDFNAAWTKLVDELVDDFDQSAKSWQDEYGKDHLAVLPVEHFDMMYNILKRLANNSYYDKPEQIPVEEVYDYCVKLYENILKELEKQEAVYGNDWANADKKKFSSAFRNSVFYKRYAGNERNPYIKNMQYQMMDNVLKGQSARDSSGSFSF